jgi:hypothetical protein
MIKKNHVLIPIISILIIFVFFGCTHFQSNVVPIKQPSAYPNHVNVDGLIVAIEPLRDVEALKQQFGVDLSNADVLPVKLIVKNEGDHEVEIDSTQIFGLLADGTMYNAYQLDQATGRIRHSEIGKEMAVGAAIGAAAGIVAGAAAGAAIGAAAGGGSDSVALGAAIGGGVGGVSGGVVGATERGDAISAKIRRELRRLDWGDRVIYPGKLIYGFLFFSRKDYQKIDINIFDIMTNKTTVVSLPLY